jgi:hypothetical protein
MLVKVLVVVRGSVRVNVAVAVGVSVDVAVGVKVSVGVGMGVLNQPPRLLSTAKKPMAVRRTRPSRVKTMVLGFKRVSLLRSGSGGDKSPASFNGSRMNPTLPVRRTFMY